MTKVIAKHYVILASATLLMLAGIYFAYVNSPWLTMTYPFAPTHAHNSAAGYAVIHGGTVFQSENVSLIGQMAVFNGFPTIPDYYWMRLMVGVAAATFTPVFGYLGGAFALNIVLLLLSALIASVFTRDIGGSVRAQAIASCLTLTGGGWLFHVTDYSAHIAAFAMYYFGVWALWRMRNTVMHDRRTLLLTGLITCIASLVYPGVLTLAACFAGHRILRKEYAVGMVALISAFLFPLCYESLLIAAKYAVETSKVGLQEGFLTFFNENRIRRPEIALLEQGRHIWASLWASGPIEAARFIIVRFGDFLFFENPITVLFGFLGLPALFAAGQNMRDRLLLIALLVAPFALAMIWVAATARGYLVFQTTILIYPAAAMLIDRLLVRNNAIGRICAIGMGFGHIAWSFAGVLGVAGILQIYFLGATEAWGQLVDPAWWGDMASGLGFVGAYPNPGAFAFPFDESLAVVKDAPQRLRVYPTEVGALGQGGELYGSSIQLVLALVARAALLLPLTIVVVALVSVHWRRCAIAIALALWVVPPTVEVLFARSPVPLFLQTMRALSVEGDAVLGNFAVSPAFANVLIERRKADDTLVLRMGRNIDGSIEKVSSSFDLDMATCGDFCTLPWRFIEQVARASAPADIRYLITGRNFTAWRPDETNTDGLPRLDLEIRLIDSNGRPKVIGF